MNYTNRLFT